MSRFRGQRFFATTPVPTRYLRLRSTVGVKGQGSRIRLGLSCQVPTTPCPWPQGGWLGVLCCKKKDPIPLPHPTAPPPSPTTPIWSQPVPPFAIKGRSQGSGVRCQEGFYFEAFVGAHHTVPLAPGGLARVHETAGLGPRCPEHDDHLLGHRVRLCQGLS